MKTIHFKQIDSTNEYCKRLGGGDVLVVADSQTAGRGTKGRSFISDEGGIYISVMREYKNFPAENAFKIMINGCVAVCRTLEELGFNPVIRWANDVLINGKKICGTLIENTFSGGKIVRSITGVGLNVNNVLPQSLQGEATTLCEAAGCKQDINAVRSLLVKNFKNDYATDDYRKYINWFGNLITVKTQEGDYTATALGVEDDGRLKIQRGEREILISSAEVSLRL